MFRKTYTIKFHRTVDENGMELIPNCIQKLLLNFCAEKGIDVRKIKIKEDYKKSYIKIKGTKEDFVPLYHGFFNASDKAKYLETITPFKI